MSGDHGHEAPDLAAHPDLVPDPGSPVFDEDWQRRAFGLAVALAEFGHYDWTEFQARLIDEIGSREQAPDDAGGRFDYYERWVRALDRTVADHGLLDPGPS